RLLDVVSDTSAAPRERNEALKWIVHLVGDIHQPLHSADNKDRGGNKVAVALEGVKTKGKAELHGVWDNELVAATLHAKSRQQPPANIKALAQNAQALMATKGQGAPDSWADESHQLAHDVAYHYTQFACAQVPSKIVVLDSGYQQEAERVIHDRLLLAGARLAA